MTFRRWIQAAPLVALLSGCVFFLDLDGDGIADPPGPPQQQLCTNVCIWDNDGECDDGGDRASSDYCDYGTDCSDCGIRLDPPTPSDEICNDICIWDNDGECDDGGWMAVSDYCDYGSDCSDCGVRER